MGWVRGPPATPRGRRILILVTLVFAIVLFLGGARNRQVLSLETSGSLLNLGHHDAKPVSGAEHLTSPHVREFWKLLNSEISDLMPDTHTVKPIRVTEYPTMDDQNPNFEADPDHPRFDHLRLPAEAVTALQTLHDGMVRALPQLAAALPYKKYSRGIVTTAGGRYFSVALVTLRMLRRTGSTLPVTVFLDTHADYDRHICGELLPALNAECVVLADLLEGAPPPVALRSYQYKAFALVFAPYQEVLFLDADAFPGHNPDTLFDAAPFRTTGMVTWPDFWVSTASPLLYEITRSGPPPPLQERRSSESGILMYDRARHAADLLLAFYYNMLGPNWYYPLMNQGSAGEGDKDAFLLAARVTRSPFYDVKTPVGVVGRWINGTWHSTGMKQADPALEWDLNPATRPQQGGGLGAAKAWWQHISTAAAAGASKLAGGSAKANHTAAHAPKVKPARPFFIHHNIVKFHVERLFEPGSALFDQDEKGHYLRLWGSMKDVTNDWGHDVEGVLWEELVAVGCDLLTPDRCKAAKELAGLLGGRPETWETGPTA